MSIASALQEVEQDDTTEEYEDSGLTENSLEKRGKGRPPVHYDAGRRVLLKKEWKKALADPEWLAVQLEKHHTLSAARRRMLLDYGKYEETPPYLEVKLSGSVDVVLAQIGGWMEKYGNDNVEIVGMEKVPIITNINDECYEPPEYEKATNGTVRCVYIECHPHKIVAKVRIPTQAF